MPTRRRLALTRAGGAVVLLATLAFVVVVSMCVGAVTIAPSTTIDSFRSFDATDSQHLIVQLQRVPRTVLGVIVGGCLGVAGAVMQALTRNPLAEPGLLGVNGGATLAIAMGISFLGITDAAGYMWLGFLGAAAAGAGVYLLGGARRGTNPVRLVLAGAALTAVLLAATQLIIVNSDDEVYNAFRYWMVGSLTGRGWDVLWPVAIVAAVGLLLAACLARPLDSASLGDDLSRSLGANPVVVWSTAGVAVILLAGVSTAAAGPISFLGLAAPHLARFLVGVNHRWVLPYSALVGAVLLVGADALGRIIAPPAEIGVGIMVSLVGGLFFIHLVRTRKIAQL